MHSFVFFNECCTGFGCFPSFYFADNKRKTGRYVIKHIFIVCKCSTLVLLLVDTRKTVVSKFGS